MRRRFYGASSFDNTCTRSSVQSISGLHDFLACPRSLPPWWLACYLSGKLAGLSTCLPRRACLSPLSSDIHSANSLAGLLIDWLNARDGLKKPLSPKFLSRIP